MSTSPLPCLDKAVGAVISSTRVSSYSDWLNQNKS